MLFTSAQPNSAISVKRNHLESCTEGVIISPVAISLRWKSGTHTQRSEEPPVLPTRVALLQDLLDRLLGLLPLADLLERVVGDGAFEAFEFEGVAGRHQVVVVDQLHEGLDLGPFFLARLRHAACDLGRVPLDAGDEGVAKGVSFVAAVDGLDDDNLEKGGDTSAFGFLELPPSPRGLAQSISPIPSIDSS